MAKTASTTTTRKLYSTSAPELNAGAPTALPTHDEIALEAYCLYEQSGAEDGHDLDHWFEAERRLRAREEGRERPSSKGQLTEQPRQQPDGHSDPAPSVQLQA
jgi:hypothetical protein